MEKINNQSWEEYINDPDRALEIVAAHNRKAAENAQQQAAFVQTAQRDIDGEMREACTESFVTGAVLMAAIIALFSLLGGIL